MSDSTCMYGCNPWPTICGGCRQRYHYYHTVIARALGPTSPRFVGYEQVQRLPLVIGLQAYRWCCPPCKKTYTDYPGYFPTASLVGPCCMR